jgi:ADP-heptose:LPS heptosyltransferase
VDCGAAHIGIGDELLVTGIARRMQQEDPTRKIMVLDKFGQPRRHFMWDNNPRIAYRKSEDNCTKIVNGPGVRPYHTGKSAERFMFNLAYRPDIGEIFFDPSELEFAEHHDPQIVIQPKVKPKASPNKAWGDARWAEFIRLARAEGYDLVELGPRGTPSMVRLINTEDFRLACAVLARAKAYVGHESGLHHAAAAVGVPGVVIFGGYTPIEVTGYPMHRNLGASMDDACGSRQQCKHCAAWMERITPEQVLNELKGMWHG